MAVEITVPRLGWSMDEGTLNEWLKREGDFVRKGDMLFVLEGDKAAQEIECFDEGYLYFLPSGPRPGDTVRVGELLGYLLAEGESPPELKTESAVISKEPKAISTDRGESDPARAVTAAPPTSMKSTIASPRARKRAHEIGVDWTEITGTGKAGRIRERDVLAAARQAEPIAARTGDEQHSDATRSISALRRTIADRMLNSHLSTAPVTLTSTADATELVRFRQEFVRRANSAEGMASTYTDMIVKLTACALQAHPAMNCSWRDNKIVRSAAIHIGIAVDTEAGLVVPVVRNVDQLSLEQLSRQSSYLIGQARSRRLTVESMQGGTFTVTNLGSYGIDAFTPIIQAPQCAILGIGRIQKAPIFQDDRFVPRDIMTLSLTFDHRIVDGGPAARFLQSICRNIEQCGQFFQ